MLIRIHLNKCKLTSHNLFLNFSQFTGMFLSGTAGLQRKPVFCTLYSDMRISCDCVHIGAHFAVFLFYCNRAHKIAPIEKQYSDWMHGKAPPCFFSFCAGDAVAFAVLASGIEYVLLCDMCARVWLTCVFCVLFMFCLYRRDRDTAERETRGRDGHKTRRRFSIEQ